MVDRRSPETSSPSDIESTGGRRASGQDSPVPIREQDRLLPIANVGRIMRQSLPANAKISKEAKETMQECVSEFISFVTAEASDKCRREKRKTINGDDILAAMTALGFEPYADSLRIYLVRYRELEGDRSSGVLQQQQAKQGLHRSPPSRTNGEYFEDPALALQRAVYGQIPRGPIAYGENRPLVLGGQNFDSAGGRGR